MDLRKLRMGCPLYSMGSVMPVAMPSSTSAYCPHPTLGGSPAVPQGLFVEIC